MPRPVPKRGTERGGGFIWCRVLCCGEEKRNNNEISARKGVSMQPQLRVPLSPNTNMCVLTELAVVEGHGSCEAC